MDDIHLDDAGLLTSPKIATAAILINVLFWMVVHFRVFS